jgi:hypothetical protein
MRLLINITCALLLTANFCSAQYQDKSSAVGVVGGYYMTNLWNKDDAKADQRLHVVQTLSYTTGVDYIGWLNNNFGIGLQALWANKGQDYSGFDTLTKTTFKYKTTLPYAQVNALVYYRSYNRYNPQQKFRFISYFGPYVGYNYAFRDQAEAFNEKGELIFGSYYDQDGLKDIKNDTVQAKFNKTIYKNLDFGFVFAPGFEWMVGPSTALTFNVRADIGASEVENKTNIQLKTDAPPYAKDFRPWDNLYAKYNPLTVEDLPAVIPDENLQYLKRAKTTNFTLGAWLGLRIYGSPRYFKETKKQ